MKKYLLSGLVALTILHGYGQFVSAQSLEAATEVEDMVLADDWYQELDDFIEDWSNSMGQDYTRYYPGELDLFQHADVTVDELLDTATIHGESVNISLAHEATGVEEWVIYAIYSTYLESEPDRRLITYLIGQGPDGIVTLVSEQVDSSIPIDFYPTANEALNSGVDSINPHAGQEEIAFLASYFAQLEGNENVDASSPYDRYQGFLYDYAQAGYDDYQIFLGGPRTDGQGNPLQYILTLDGQDHLMFGPEGTEEVQTIWTLMGQTEPYDVLGLFRYLDTDEVVIARQINTDVYETINEPGLIAGYLWAESGAIDSQQLQDILEEANTIAVANPIIELYYQRDQSYSQAEVEAFLLPIVPDWPESVTDLVLGEIRRVEKGYGYIETLLNEVTPGSFAFSQGMGGPVVSFHIFAVDNELITVSLNNYPVGNLAKYDRETLEVIESFEVSRPHVEEFRRVEQGEKLD